MKIHAHGKQCLSFSEEFNANIPMSETTIILAYSMRSDIDRLISFSGGRDTASDEWPYV